MNISAKGHEVFIYQHWFVTQIWDAHSSSVQTPVPKGAKRCCLFSEWSATAAPLMGVIHSCSKGQRAGKPSNNGYIVLVFFPQDVSGGKQTHYIRAVHNITGYNRANTNILLVKCFAKYEVGIRADHNNITQQCHHQLWPEGLSLKVLYMFLKLLLLQIPLRISWYCWLPAAFISHVSSQSTGNF